MLTRTHYICADLILIASIRFAHTFRTAFYECDCVSLIRNFFHPVIVMILKVNEKITATRYLIICGCHAAALVKKKDQEFLLEPRNKYINDIIK